MPVNGYKFSNLVTSDDGSMPINMMTNKELEPMAGSKTEVVGD